MTICKTAVALFLGAGVLVGCENGPAAPAGTGSKTGAQKTSVAPVAAAPVVKDAKDVKPLGVGAQVPGVNVRDVQGKTHNLAKLADKGPAVLVFYRGGWCPYCTKHLSALQAIEGDLKAAGYTLYGITPDRPEKLAATAAKEKLGYTLLSDADASAVKAFGLGFVVDDLTIEKYKTFKINLDEASGYSHHILPVPAVYVVEKGGKIKFVHYDPDYRKRLDAKDVLAAAQAK